MKISAGIFLFDPDGYLLICHPTNHAKDFWSITKGGIDYFETEWDAAVRELKEESNITLDGLDYTVEECTPIIYKSKKKTLHPFFVMLNEPIRDIITCTSYVTDKKGIPMFPEMDDFVWCKPKRAYNFIHETQQRAYDWMRENTENKKLKKLLKK